MLFERLFTSIKFVNRTPLLLAVNARILKQRKTEGQRSLIIANSEIFWAGVWRFWHWKR